MQFKKRLTAALLAGLLLLTAACGGPVGGDAPNEQQEPSAARDDFRAVWVATVYNLDYPSAGTTDETVLKRETDAILENCVELGMNAVILQVRPSCDALYPSKLFPWSSYLTGTAGQAPGGGFDPLAYWVERAHALGLELHAWVNPFRVTKSGEDELNALPASSPAKQHPEWVAEYEKNFYLDPGIPEVRELVLQGAEELVNNYDLDGIHLDDYFYPGKGFDDADTYARYGGSFSDLGDWRRDNVNQLIRELDTRLHAIDPELSFGVSPSGVWADKDNQSAGSATTGRYESYYAAYADSRKWVQEGWVDYICPQIYWYIGHAKLDYETIARWWTETVKGTEVKLYIGMADYMADDGKEGSPWEGLDALKAQLALNRELKVSGECHFRYKFLVANTNLKALYQDWYGAARTEPSSGFLAGLPASEQEHWAAGYYGRLGDMGIVTGYEDGSYRPERSVERSSMAALVCRALEHRSQYSEDMDFTVREDAKSPFPDTVGNWAEPQIAALCEAGFLDISDYPDGFQPDQPMTRLELVKLLVRSDGNADNGNGTMPEYEQLILSAFPDVKEGACYVVSALENGYIQGYDDGLFHPNDPVDRGQAAAILCRYLGVS